MGKTTEYVKTPTRGSRARGAKKFLLSRGVKMAEMKEYLCLFLESYGHTEVREKSLGELLDKAGLFFPSLKKYTDGKHNKKFV